MSTTKDYTNDKPKSINALESALAFLPRRNTLLALGYRYGVDANIWASVFEGNEIMGHKMEERVAFVSQ
jgi:hypothetical protein